ncbi:MAG: hypothetical protein JRG96_02095 [Deltaproteobacteria bacterium]|nr:hypothetical protein [Deltaproteobacteria bacterium]MBW2417032.1 hypothetical protein [Deltaproteobacteria bacterium]
MPSGSRHGGSRRGFEGDSVTQALERARAHARLAVSEGVRAARALLDASSLSLGGERPEAFASLGRAAKMLDDLSAGLAGDGLQLSLPVFDAVLTALDVEIGRWENRSQSDPDARAVLRAFLGLREILWEFGMRRAGGEANTSSDESPEADLGAGREANPGRSDAPQRSRVERRPGTADSERRKSAIPRVQHIKIQG